MRSIDRGSSQDAHKGASPLFKKYKIFNELHERNPHANERERSLLVWLNKKMEWSVNFGKIVCNLFRF